MQGFNRKREFRAIDGGIDNMFIGEIALWNHERKSSHPLKNYLSSSDFRYYLAVEDGYINSIPRWWFW